jgi:protein-disulfide isomerase
VNKQRLIFAAAAVLLVAAFVVGSSLYQKKRAQDLGFIAEKSFATFVRPHSQVMGNPDAKVWLVEFTDPACETCAAFSPLVKQILAANPDKVKLVVRYAPFHQGSEGVVRMLHASVAQGKFWNMLELMYKSQPSWASHHQPQPELLWDFVGAAGLDKDRLARDVQSQEIAAIVAQDIADARTLGVNKTPGFFVNGKPLVQFGARELEQLVRTELAIAYPQ